jgi:Flp pilus assembly protein TadB
MIFIWQNALFQSKRPLEKFILIIFPPSYPIVFMIYQLSFMLKKNKSESLWEEHLPLSIEILRGCLLAGMNLCQSIEFLVNNQKTYPAITESFQKILDNFYKGCSFEKSIDFLIPEITYPDFKGYLLMLILSQKSGGDLPKILQKYKKIYLMKTHLRKKIILYTTQIKFQCKIISLLPVFAFVFLSIFYPEKVSFFFHYKVGFFLLILSVGLNLCGWYLFTKSTKSLL